MAFCSKCGKKLEDNAKFCPSCGQPVVNAEKGNEVISNNQNIYQTSDTTENKVLGILSYIGILVLIPIIVAPNSKFVRFHSNQGLVLFIFEIALTVVSQILKGISSQIFVLGIVSVLLNIAFSLLGLALFALVIVGIIYAAQGQTKELPVIGQIKILK